MAILIQFLIVATTIINYCYGDPWDSYVTVTGKVVCEKKENLSDRVSLMQSVIKHPKVLTTTDLKNDGTFELKKTVKNSYWLYILIEFKCGEVEYESKSEWRNLDNILEIDEKTNTLTYSIPKPIEVKNDPPPKPSEANYY